MLVDQREGGAVRGAIRDLFKVGTCCIYTTMAPSTVNMLIRANKFPGIPNIPSLRSVQCEMSNYLLILGKA